MFWFHAMRICHIKLKVDFYLDGGGSSSSRVGRIFMYILFLFHFASFLRCFVPIEWTWEMRSKARHRHFITWCFEWKQSDNQPMAAFRRKYYAHSDINIYIVVDKLLYEFAHPIERIDAHRYWRYDDVLFSCHFALFAFDIGTRSMR